jgi:ABC-2 type transport system permease protein
LLDMQAGWMGVLAQVPFLSPFLMLSRVTGGEATGFEVGLSVAILAVTIVVALWIAARIYAAGVLLYGQRPGIRAIWRLMRTGM